MAYDTCEYTKDTDGNSRGYIIDAKDIQEITYYITPIDNQGNVKLAIKCTLVNGEKYGNVIQIPFDELKRLVAQVDKHE